MSSCPCAICKPYIRVKELIFVVVSNVLIRHFLTYSFPSRNGEKLSCLVGWLTEWDFSQCEEEKSHMLFLCFIADVGGVH